MVDIVKYIGIESLSQKKFLSRRKNNTFYV